MAKWITLIEIEPAASPSAVLRFAAQDTPGPDGPYLGLLAGFSDFERAVPRLPGLPIVSQFQLSFKNHEGYFSQILAQYELRGATCRMKIGLDGTALSGFSTQFTGTVIDLARPLTPGFCNFVVKDSSADRWSQEIPNDIPVSDFPNLPEKSPDARANIIFGHVSSVGKGDQGAVNCPLVDTVDHLYLVARHKCDEVLDVYVLGGDGSELYDIEEYDAPSGRTYTLIRAHEDWEDPEKTATEFAVACDVKGHYDEAGDLHLITNPAEAARLFNTEYCGYDEALDFEETSYAQAFADFALAEYAIGTCIDAAGQCESIIQKLQDNFNLEIYFDEDGQMAFHLLTVEEADPADPVFDDVEDIQLGTFQVVANDQVINALAIHYDRDPSSGKYLKEPPAVNNLLSQLSIGVIIREELEMPMVSTFQDPASPSAPSSGDLTALEVASVRLYYSDEGRWGTVFQLSAPQTPGGLLTSRIKVTHPFGLSAAGTGWSEMLFRVIGIRYLDLLKTPKVQITAIQLEPGPTAYMMNAEPINAVWGSSSETAAGLINVNWTLAAASPSSGPDPAWIHVWVKRVEDELSSRFLRFAGRFAASALTAQISAIFPTSTSLNIYLRPESADGVLRRDIEDVATGVHSARTLITTVSDLAVVNVGLLANLSWSDLVDADDLAMFHHWQLWIGATDVFADMVLHVDGLVESEYSDRDYVDNADIGEGPTCIPHYRVVAVSKYGVSSDPSNAVSIDMALELSAIVVTVEGATFKMDIGLPTGVSLDEIWQFREAYSETIWGSPPIFPNHRPDLAEVNILIGTETHKEGTVPEKTYYFAALAIFKSASGDGTLGHYGKWTYLMDGLSPEGYLAVTSGIGVRLQGDAETNIIGSASDAAQRIEYNQVTGQLTLPGIGGLMPHEGFTAAGGETYVDLSGIFTPVLVSLNGVLRRPTTGFTYATVGAVTRVTLVGATDVPLVAGDFVDVWRSA